MLQFNLSFQAHLITLRHFRAGSENTVTDMLDRLNTSASKAAMSKPHYKWLICQAERSKGLFVVNFGGILKMGDSKWKVALGCIIQYFTKGTPIKPCSFFSVVLTRTQRVYFFFSRDILCSESVCSHSDDITSCFSRCLSAPNQGSPAAVFSCKDSADWLNGKK